MESRGRDIAVFADGASRGNPGPGGWGVILVTPLKENGEITSEVAPLHVVELGGREEYTTNNRMELTAGIRALEYIHGRTDGAASIRMYVDSSYVVNGIETFVARWRERGWRTTQNKDVRNRDLWERLSVLASGKKIEWRLVGGHVGVVGNERADEIATSFADGLSPKRYRGPLARYPYDLLQTAADEKRQAAKDSRRVRGSEKPYSYVSVVDGVVATHKTWAECGVRVRGKSGARWKKTRSPEEEARVMKDFMARRLPLR